MTERVSALMDGELADDVAAREAALLRSDAESRQAWNTYHLIGDALRGDCHREYDRDVVARLAAEPVVLAPRQRQSWLGRGDRNDHNDHSNHGASRDWRLVRYALSAAASVAGVALVIWTAAPVLAPSSAQMAQAPQTQLLARVTPASPAVTRPDARAVASARGVENYLLAHQRYSPANAMQGVAPYVRLVSEERDEVIK